MPRPAFAPAFVLSGSSRPSRPVPDAGPAARRAWGAIGVPVLAAITLALGFAALAGGSVSAAPALLVLDYCVLVPLAILCGGRSRRGGA